MARIVNRLYIEIRYDVTGMSFRRHTVRIPVLAAAAFISLLQFAIEGRNSGVAFAAPQPVPRDLAIPASAFPHGSKITTDTLRSHFGSELHAARSDQAQTAGYRQTASWNSPDPKRRDVHWSFSLRVTSAIFGQPSDAARYAGGALETLWENGFPIVLPSGGRAAFSVRERGGKVADFLVIQRGAAESELRLIFPSQTPARLVNSVVLHLVKAGNVLDARFLRVVPDAGVPQPGAILPPIVTAEMGTGPVIKSPSLMSIGAASLPSGSTLLPGEFRTGRSSLAGRAITTATVAVDSGLSRFAAVVEGTSRIYAASSLYPNADAATAALRALSQANDEAGLSRQDDQALETAVPSLTEADEIDAWTNGQEALLAFRYANALVVLAGAGSNAAGLGGIAASILATVPTPLQAQGTQVVDAAGRPVQLHAVNWYGAESQDYVVGGLDVQPYQAILQNLQTLGFNAIRIPFSDQLVQQNPIVTAHLAANPSLQGLHALDILDRIVGYAGALGISVILDNHRSEAGWSAESGGLWYTAQYPDSVFVADWSTIAARYASTDAVIGMDLRNEPHGAATWGTGDPATDWRAAAMRAGDAVLAADPHVLILVEGVQFSSPGVSYWWGGNLRNVATFPVQLQFADGSSAQSRLVYSAHDYGPGACGGGCPWFNATTTYQSLSAIWDQNWGFIAQDPSKPYAAPVWVGEFGTCNVAPRCVADATPGSQGQWFSSFVRYLTERGLGWVYWAANGTQSGDANSGRTYGTAERYGMLMPSWSAPNAVLQAALEPLLQPAATGA